MQLTPGANAPIDGNTVEISWHSDAGRAELDVSAYLLTASGTVDGDNGMVFYGQLQVPGAELRLNQKGRQAVFTLDLARLPASIEKIAFCAALDTNQEAGRKLADVGSISMAMGEHTFLLPLSGTTEQAMIIAEIYRRNGAFKVRAVGQGFNGGLGPLATHFGVDVEGSNEPAPLPAAPKPAAPAVAPAPAPSVSLKKVTLTKSEKVSLKKNTGPIRAKLVWEGRRGGGGDLDLYCHYVTKDGKCGKVYWKDLGRDHGMPYITLSGDSQRAGEEEIVLHRPEELRYALFSAYSAVGNGAGSFASYRPKMIFTSQDGSEVTVPLLNPVATSYWVAITHLDIDREITIEHVETYGKSGRAFIAAERSPRLHADGTWDVSKGIIEFKR